MDVFCYLVACPRTKEALAIDPAGDEERIVERIKQKALNLKYIKALTGAKIIMHELDDRIFNSPQGRERTSQMGFAPSPSADITVKDGDHITVGDVSLEVIHTPGHSPGGICLLGNGNLFTGDTLFVGGMGRTDLPGSSMSDFMKAIKERLLTLPGETIIWPGHDYGMRPSSTIEGETRTNPWLS